MSQYLDFAKQLALEVGDIMLEHFTIGVKEELKSDFTPVTIADTTINSHVIAAVAEKFPDHSVRGEEESTHTVGDKYVWVCDPIDGTRAYTFGIPTNVFSTALVEDGVPICAVVYDPYLKRMYWAEKGKGAYLNGERLHVSKQPLERDAAIALASYTAEMDTNQLYVKCREKVLKVFLLHSDIYEAMAVASGQFVAKVSVSQHPHDVVTSKLIVEEAGGKVTDIYGNDQRYDQPTKGALITNGIVHDDMLALIKQST